MGPQGREIRRAIDALAGALVLADATEPECVVELVAALEQVRACCAPTHDSHALAGEAIALLEASRGRPTRELSAALDALGTVVERLRIMSEQEAAAAEKAEPEVAPAANDLPKAEAGEGADFVVVPAASPLLEDAELRADFLASCDEQFEAADACLLTLDTAPSDADALNSLFRCFHTIKGMSGFMGLTALEAAAHDGEELLAEARSGAIGLAPQAVQSLFAGVDRMRALVADVRGEARTSVRPLADEAGAAPAAAPADTAAPASAPGARRNETVRVDARKLDDLLDAISELAIAQASVGRSGTDRESEDFRRRVERLDKITRELQEMATALRMVTLRSTFSRMSRVVRDVAKRVGKDVEFVTVGVDTELDRGIVEALNDPLVHLLRNAVDHGVEEHAEERVAACKPPRARIELRAFHRGGSVYIQVADDGRGLDADAIRDAATEAGLPAPLTEREALELIFSPGFSTAARVTDISGRGVGMDVVRGTIESLRGQIEVSSVPGAGCTFSIRLPLTLASIEGMVVGVGSERLVLPTLSIVRCVRLASSATAVSHDGSEMLRDQGEVMRLLRLGPLFGLSDAPADPDRAIAVVAEEDGKRVALLVDELLDQQQVVVKSLAAPVQESPGIAGASVMPDGAPALIVDVAGVFRLAERVSLTRKTA